MLKKIYNKKEYLKYHTKLDIYLLILVNLLFTFQIFFSIYEKKSSVGFRQEEAELFEIQRISRSIPYGDLADGDAAVVSWLALDAIFPSEIIALRPTKKLLQPLKLVQVVQTRRRRVLQRGENQGKRSEGEILRRRVEEILAKRIVLSFG